MLQSGNIKLKNYVDVHSIDLIGANEMEYTSKRKGYDHPRLVELDFDTHRTRHPFDRKRCKRTTKSQKKLMKNIYTNCKSVVNICQKDQFDFANPSNQQTVKKRADSMNNEYGKKSH